MDLALLLGDGTAQGPVVLRVGGLGKAGVAELELIREIGRIGVIRPGFQQQHRSMRVCRQSAGQYRPGGAAANDRYVVFHWLSFADIPRILMSASAIVSPYACCRNGHSHAASACRSIDWGLGARLAVVLLQPPPLDIAAHDVDPAAGWIAVTAMILS